MESLQPREILLKIIMVLICFFVGMKIVIPLLMHTYEKNCSLKYLSQAIDNPRNEDDLISPPEGMSMHHYSYQRMPLNLTKYH